MKAFWRASALTVLTAAWLLLVQFPAHAGMIFPVEFDNTFNASMSPPYVGSGTLSFSDNLADGTWLLSGLTDVSMSFTFDDGEQFTQADLVDYDPLSSLLSIVIVNAGGNFYFDGPPGSGPVSGAADFVNANGAILSFEPNVGFGPAPWNQYVEFDATAGFAGTYGTVPEPTTITIWSVIFVMVAATACRRKQCDVDIPRANSHFDAA